MTTTATYGEVLCSDVSRETWTRCAMPGWKDLNYQRRCDWKQRTLPLKKSCAGGSKNRRRIYQQSFQGYAVARCNPSGPCIITLMVAPEQYYEAVKTMVVQVMRTSSFAPPSTASPYVDFDWNEFLSNKVLVAYAFQQGGSKEMRFTCVQTGHSRQILRRADLWKSKSGIPGRTSGKWTVSGTGPSTTIQFTFNKKDLPSWSAVVDREWTSNEQRRAVFCRAIWQMQVRKINGMIFLMRR